MGWLILTGWQVDRRPYRRAVRARWKGQSGTCSYGFTDYSRRRNPPILHRKELLLPADQSVVTDGWSPSPAVPCSKRLRNQREVKRKSRDDYRHGFVQFVDPRLADRAIHHRPARVWVCRRDGPHAFKAELANEERTCTSNHASSVPGPASATPARSSLWPLASRPSDGQRYPSEDSVPYVHPERASVTRETAATLRSRASFVNSHLDPTLIARRTFGPPVRLESFPPGSDQVRRAPSR